MSKRIHVHTPYTGMPEHLEYLLKKRVNPELFFSADALDKLDCDILALQSDAIHTAGLTTTIHAPFLDLNPGAIDISIREATAKRVQQIIKVAELLKPKVIVFHPGYDELRYGNSRGKWLANSISFWREFIAEAKALGFLIAMENIFEKEPSTLRALIEAVNDKSFGHCFDTGHWNMFTRVQMEDWFEELGEYIFECHIHDNHGQIDEHLPLGEGEIDFDLFFGLVGHYAPDAVWTLEAHTAERIERALKNVTKYY